MKRKFFFNRYLSNTILRYRVTLKSFQRKNSKFWFFLVSTVVCSTFKEEKKSLCHDYLKFRELLRTENPQIFSIIFQLSQKIKCIKCKIFEISNYEFLHDYNLNYFCVFQSDFEALKMSEIILTLLILKESRFSQKLGSYVCYKFSTLWFLQNLDSSL